MSHESKMPWETEPDYETFIYGGFKCEIKRHPSLLHLCGYVYIPSGHEVEKIAASNLYVHGGITYDKFDGKFRVIGFDCAHSEDALPYYYPTKLALCNPENYKDFNFVREELKSMVNQIESI